MYGYWTTDPKEAWLIDSTMDSINDEASHLAQIQFSAPEQKREMLFEYLTRGLPIWLGIMEKRVAGKKFLVGSRLTCADFFLGAFLLSGVANPHGAMFFTCQHILKSFPHLSAYIENFKLEVKQRIDTRSPAPM